MQLNRSCILPLFQVQDFQNVVVAFKTRFENEGPGLTTISLDQVPNPVHGAEEIGALPLV